MKLKRGSFSVSSSTSVHLSSCFSLPVKKGGVDNCLIHHHLRPEPSVARKDPCQLPKVDIRPVHPVQPGQQPGPRWPAASRHGACGNGMELTWGPHSAAACSPWLLRSVVLFPQGSLWKGHATSGEGQRQRVGGKDWKGRNCSYAIYYSSNPVALQKINKKSFGKVSCRRLLTAADSESATDSEKHG